MFGPDGKYDGSNSGIVPRALELLFEKLKENTEIQTYEIKIGILEIYLEKIKDLLIDVSNNINSNNSFVALKYQQTHTYKHKNAMQA